jgi:SSS family solute:Na+ symporter
LPGIIKTLLIAYTAFTGGLLVPTIAGFYKEWLHPTSSGALCAMIGGGTTALFFGQSHPLWGMIVSLVLLLAVSRLEGMLARRRLTA